MRHRHRRRCLALFVSVLAAASAGCGAASPSGTLSATDERDIRALDSSYVAAWLQDDTAAVMATLAPAAVLMPGGHRPLTTPEEIRGFWWPRDGSQTRVTAFTRRIEELQGGDDLAYLRGRDSVGFSYRKDTVSLNAVSKTMTLSILRRGSDGRWRISRMMWAVRSN